MSRIPSNRNRNSQQSNARGIEHNTKFIPFFRHHDRAEDTRIAYFIAHLREEVNRHKGINIPYIPTNIRTTLYEEDIIPDHVTALINRIAHHPNSSKNYDIKKLINYEIEYTGNIRFLLIPASMREDSELYHAWIGFFCQLFARLHDNAINGDNTALQFVKTLKEKEEKKDPYEYLFAVAVVRTFLKELVTMQPDATTGTLEEVHILDKPKQWHTATRGVFISSDEMLIRLFAPGKIYNKKTLLVRTPAVTASFKLNQKYYNIQKGGAMSEHLLKMYKENLTNLQPYLTNFVKGLYKDTITKDMETARNDLETNYSNYIQALKMFYKYLYEQNSELMKIISTVLLKVFTPDQLNTYLGKMKNFFDNQLSSIESYDKYKAEYADKSIDQTDTEKQSIIDTIKILSGVVVEVLKVINKALNMPAKSNAKAAKSNDADDAPAETAEQAAAEAAEKVEKQQKKAEPKGMPEVVEVEVPLAEAVTADAGKSQEEIDKLTKEVDTLKTDLKAARESGKTTYDELQVKLAELKTMQDTLASASDAAKLAGVVAHSISNATMEIKKDIGTQLAPVTADLQVMIKSGVVNTKQLDQIIIDINKVVIKTLQTLTTKKFEINIPASGDSAEDLIESLPTTKMYETLKQCNHEPNAGYITKYNRLDFETEDVDKFFKNRLKRLYKEVDNEINKRDTVELDSTGTLAKIAAAHGIKSGDNKYKYERIKGELVVTDLETNEKVKTTRDTSCKNMGFNFADTNDCYNFLNSCILGKDTEACKAKLGNHNFWRTDLVEFRHNSNFKDVFLSLERYGFKTISKGILQQIEPVNAWQARNTDVTVPLPVIALLMIAVEEINKHPAILNSNYTGPQKQPQAPHNKGDKILAMKLQPSSRESLPEELRQPTDPLKETGVIYKTDKITIAVNTRADEIKNLLKDEMKALQYELTLLKAPLLGASARTKYFHSQRGGSQDYDLHSYEHYNTMTLLKEHIKKLDTRISGILMQSFNVYINALNAKGIKLDVTNQNKIKEELAKIRRLEIFLTHTAFYVYKFIFFFSEFKAYLPIIDPSYEDFIGKIEINLDQLEKLVDATHAKFKTYCANTADGATKSGKVYALATICSQLEELTFPKLSDLEELPPGFRYDDQKNKNKTGRTSYNYFT